MANKMTWTVAGGDGSKSVDFHVGDTVAVHYKLIEKEKVAGKAKKEVHEETRERTQPFEGIVLSIKGSGNNAMFMVRKIGAGNVGIERIFPVVSPWIRKLEVKKRAHVRRSKLYYLRDKKGKDATRLDELAQSASPTKAR